ncbi:DUF6768 family protein [Thalassotalea piscium]|uniref:Heme/copper-type cytochrome/quinol oxidase subunit 4 n=1 Tax=Thalassotalea piscium TaxID=1230533 RepID=A0A7X0TVD6_9GAMM|nr:DUF6768 family protein [Thalassotalea piscium]MBB6545010.1 heme/copper-type cytochrome/quinol oxidase subunit 4 [Thalassotalea piscium]
MNLDERIKQELSDEAKHLDQQLANDSGIFTMLANAFKGSLGRWLVIVLVVGLLVTVLMLYSGYQFFFVEGNIAFKLHWGVVLLVATMVQISLKMWSFMEMNRQSSLREIKRLELMVEKLCSQK